MSFIFKFSFPSVLCPKLVTSSMLLMAKRSYLNNWRYFCVSSDLMQEPSAVSDAEHLCAAVNGMSDALVPHLKDLHHLLSNPPKVIY